jgi:hypothetical protein
MAKQAQAMEEEGNNFMLMLQARGKEEVIQLCLSGEKKWHAVL